jgi:uncharacterized protein with PIN domain
VKPIQPRQTVCDDPRPENKKTPYCGGKLKRITELDAEARKQAGAGNDVFRCQECGMLYVDQSPYAAVKR